MNSYRLPPLQNLSAECVKSSKNCLFEVSLSPSKPATCLGLLPVVAQFTPLRGHFADALVRVLFFFFNASSFSGCCSVAGCRSCQSTGEFEVWVDIALPALQKCQPLAGARCQPKMPDSQNNPAQKLDRSLPHFPETRQNPASWSPLYVSRSTQRLREVSRPRSALAFREFAEPKARIMLQRPSWTGSKNSASPILS